MNDSTRQWVALVCGSLVLGLLMATPQILHKRHSAYQGISIHVNSDEAVYLARVQESLNGRPEQASEAFIGHPGLVGSQVAFIETWYGRLFRWTGWNAATVLDVMDIVMPILLFLSLFVFFRVAGLHPWLAFGGAAAFCLLQLYNLGRPIHMRSSFFLMLWSLIGISVAVRSRWWGVGLGGVLLGLLVGVYFWSFTFAWAFWGVYLAWELAEWGHGKWQEHHKKSSRIKRALHTAWGVLWHFRPRKPSFQFESWHLLGITGIIGLLAALPSIAHFFAMMTNPLYDYASFRSGMHPGRLPESVPYSLLFIGMLVSAVVMMVREYEEVRPHRMLLVMIFATCMYMHQNVFHGVTFNFVSHGIFTMATASIGIILLWLQLRSRFLSLGALCAIIYLLAIGYDGRYVLNQWTVRDNQYVDQHLAEVISVLDTLPRGRILSDPQTSAVIAGYSHHDTVYSVYLKNILMSHEELASRYCLTQIPIPPVERNIAGTRHLIFPDASAAFGAEVRTEEVRLVENACRELDLDAGLSMETFEIDYVLWNRKRAPNWDLKRIPVILETIASGEEWVLLAMPS